MSCYQAGAKKKKKPEELTIADLKERKSRDLILNEETISGMKLEREDNE